MDSYVREVALLAVTFSALVAQGCASGTTTSARSETVVAATAPCSADNAGLTLPPGFCASVFADSLGRARHLTVASNGDVYVAIEGTRPVPPGRTAPATPSFIALRDGNGDGRADVIERVGSRGNTGIELHDGYLYVDEGERIVRYARPEGQLVPSLPPQVIVQGIPMNPGHRARNFVFGKSSELYVNVGSPSNACQVKDRAVESPGKDACEELETRAGIWKFDASAIGQNFSPAARYATGSRNSTGLAFGDNGRLYAMTHGRDQLHENWLKVFTDSTYGHENPGEEMIQVEQGDDFGWPYCYYAVDRLRLVDGPEYGGDGQKTTRCASKEGPVAVYPAHWAPLSLLVYRATAFPERYRGGAFISFHGSWNRARGMQAGGKIVFQPTANGAPSGRYEIFADGFAGVPPQEIAPATAKHRPVGLAVGPDGSLYVADDAGGRIYRITYNAQR